MIEITIDHNSDRLEIRDHNGKRITEYKHLKDTSMIQRMLLEIINAIDPKDVRISEIVEEFERTVEEYLDDRRTRFGCYRILCYYRYNHNLNRYFGLFNLCIIIFATNVTEHGLLLLLIL